MVWREQVLRAWIAVTANTGRPRARRRRRQRQEAWARAGSPRRCASQWACTGDGELRVQAGLGLGAGGWGRL